MNKNEKLLQTAERISKNVRHWTEFSNALFDPWRGIIAQAYSRAEDRAQFLKSDTYKEIQKILAEIRKRTWLLDPPPVTLHAQAAPLLGFPGSIRRQPVILPELLHGRFEKIPKERRTEIMMMVAAFLEVSDGYPLDRVIFDPFLNGQYLTRCRQAGLSKISDQDLNRELLDASRNGLLEWLPKPDRIELLSDAAVEPYDFACEIALSYSVQELRREEGKSSMGDLEYRLCDPESWTHYDETVESIAPGRSYWEYRWTALNRFIRRADFDQNLKIKVPKMKPGKILAKAADSLPNEPGIFIISEGDNCVYIGETANLRQHIEGNYINSSAISSIYKKLKGKSMKGFMLEYVIVEVKPEDRKMMSRKLLATKNPLLNFPPPT